MPLLSDRVLESTTTTGTGTFALGGALTGYRTFNSAFSNGDVVYYTADNGQGEWEVGYGTVGTGTLTRTVIESSNANALVNFSSGAKNIFCTAPAVGIFNASTGGIISGPSVISTSSSSDALRITQTGAGNALVVEDSANPDATPFVIDATGDVVIGASASIPGAFSDTGKLQIAQATGEAIQAGFTFTNATGGSYIYLNKSRAATVGVNTILQNNDVFGGLVFAGADGTTYHRGASIFGEVDGTPGTNDMPGRLVFTTTADGASSPTERMRIRSDGNIGIGDSGATNYALKVGGTYRTGGHTAINAVRADGTIPSTSPDAAIYFQTLVNQAAGFTLVAATHFAANQGTFSGTVANQYGFNVASSLTGATNNYGFYSNIASGTGRRNFYAAGSAANYMAGPLYVGSNYYTNIGIGIAYNSGTPSANAIYIDTTVTSATTGTYTAVGTYMSTQAAAFTLNNFKHFSAGRFTIGAGSSVTTQVGFTADSSLTGATNNYGFYSNIAGGTGRYNFYAAGSADNYFAGNTTIAGTTTLNSSLNGLVKTTSGVVSSTTVTLSVKNRAGSTISVGLALS